MMRAARTLAVTFCAAMAFAPAAMAETVWTMPSGLPESNFFTKNIRMFIEEVDAATGGELKIDLRPNNELMKLDMIKRGVQSGSVPIGEIRLGVYGNEDQMNLLSGVPNLASDYDQAQKLMDAQMPYFDKVYGENGMMVLSYAPWPGQGFFTKMPVDGPEDLAGLRVRVYSASTEEMAGLLDMRPTILPFAEVPQAFSTGLIDSLFTSAQTGEDIQVWDYVDHYVYTGSMHPKNAIIVNRRAFDRLDEGMQTALVEAGRRATERSFTMSRDANEATLAALQAHGITVTEGSEALQSRLSEIGATMLEEWASSANPEQQAVLDAYEAARGN
ncbi:TRAP transporter substrate-binding protein [Falsirhodobacter halotolerans]|uniref:TRAP transporter substrate-binding protein n=1 Tax=Falsirhodobacter halotolerans TaxID=1146892 RepID=UPI001FD58299|nr:TRAP transporter substrate-binding protein [Falsirhodobacter halotolerans]MCJ8138273.1 TRAP transporter substrate-binding protein [Falsirhodobacter halotolerans]